MISGATIDGQSLDFMLHKPIGCLGIAAREMIEEDITIRGEILVPAGVDDDEIAFLDFGFGIIQVFLADDIPLLEVPHVNDDALSVAA